MIINPYAFAGGGGGGGFDPLDLSPALWLDGSDASTLYDATSGGSLVAADGTVARWEDKSGNGRHASQTSSGLRPIRKTNVQNSRDIVRFDGSSMLFSAAIISGSTPGTAVYVMKNFADPPPGDISAGAPLAQWGSAGPENHFPYSDGTIYDDFGTDARKTCGNPSTPLDQFNLISQISASGAWDLWINGSLFYNTTSNNVGWGSSPKISLDSTFFFKGDIAEILVFPSALDTSDREDVEAYLTAKWGI